MFNPTKRDYLIATLTALPYVIRFNLEHRVTTGSAIRAIITRIARDFKSLNDNSIALIFEGSIEIRSLQKTFKWNRQEAIDMSLLCIDEIIKKSKIIVLLCHI